MRAHKLKVMIPEDRELTVHVPEDVPVGPAEVIVLAEPQTTPSEDQAPSEASRRLEDLAASLAADPRPFRELTLEERRARLQKVMGIGRGLLSSSDEFARRKQEEIDLEERRFGR